MPQAGVRWALGRGRTRWHRQMGSLQVICKTATTGAPLDPTSWRIGSLLRRNLRRPGQARMDP